jgi:adenylylsulfate kinase
VTDVDRERLLRQKGVTVWMTGLSGSGKSTIAQALEKRLIEQGHACYILDGDNVRHGLNRDLGFSAEDRAENIRRVAEVCKLFSHAGVIVITAFISPYLKDRAQAREIVGDDRFLEVFVDTPLEVCEERDVKGLYKKARAGEIQQFTGVSDPYEAPENPDLLLSGHTQSIDQTVDVIVADLAARSVLVRSGE